MWSLYLSWLESRASWILGSTGLLGIVLYFRNCLYTNCLVIVLLNSLSSFSVIPVKHMLDFSFFSTHLLFPYLYIFYLFLSLCFSLYLSIDFPSISVILLLVVYAIFISVYEFLSVCIALSTFQISIWITLYADVPHFRQYWLLETFGNWKLSHIGTVSLMCTALCSLEWYKARTWSQRAHIAVSTVPCRMRTSSIPIKY